MVECLSNRAFGTIVLTSMSEAEGIALCRHLLTSIADPRLAPELLHTGHLIARHADVLARSSLSVGGEGGPCRPARDPSSPACAEVGRG